MKNYSYWADKANLAYYRDYNAKEIDVIVEENGQVHPLEFKKSAMARPQRDQKISGTRQDGLSTGQQRHYLYVRRSHAHRSEKQLYPLHLI